MGSLLLTPEQTAARGVTLKPCLAVVGSGRVLLGVEGNVYDLARGERLFATPVGGLGSFACVEEGPLLAVAGTALGYPKGGRLQAALELPLAEMQVACGGRGRVLLFGGAPGRGVIYAYGRGGRSEHLLELDRPVTALAAAGEDLYFASGGELFLLRADRSLELSAVLAVSGEIRSLAFDADRLVLYLVAGRSLHALVDGEVRRLADEGADAVAVHGGQLYLLDAREGRLIRLASPPWAKRAKP